MKNKIYQVSYDKIKSINSICKLTLNLQLHFIIIKKRKQKRQTKYFCLKIIISKEQPRKKKNSKRQLTTIRLMENHYEKFKQNLSKIQIDFKRLVESSQNKGLMQKKTADAKKVAIMIEKYMDQSPNMLYEILTRNLGKTEISWDDLLKCLQDQFYLSYTVLKRQSKKFSISQAVWNNNVQFSKILQYLKAKQTNYIQSILKPNLGVNISQHSSDCDILAVLLEKQLIFYLVQEDRIVCTFDFKYNNVKDKLLKKYQARQVKRQQSLRENESFDIMPENLQRRISFVDANKSNSKILKNSKRKIYSQQKTRSANSKIQHRSRLNSNASSDISSFLKRNSTDIGVSDWKKKSSIQKDESVKIRTNTTKKVFQYFQNCKLQSSIEIAKKFKQARNSFQKYIVLDKKLLQKQIKIDVEDIQIQKKTIDFKAELEKMKNSSKNMQKYHKKYLMRGSNDTKTNDNEYYSNDLNQNQKSFDKFHKFYMFSQSKPFEQASKDRRKSKNFFTNESHSKILSAEQIQKPQSGDSKLLQDSKIGIVSFSFVQNYLLLSFYNRQVRLYRIKKNLHRLKEDLLFQKENQNLVIFVQIYRSIFAQTYNMVLCSSKNNDTPVVKIYEILNQALFSSSNFKQEQVQVRSQFSKESCKQHQKYYKELFCCKLAFDPIYESLIPLGIGAFNEKGFFSLIETNRISADQTNRSEVKLFEKQFFNLVTGDLVSISVCKAHANNINLYLVCKNGFIYLIDKISSKIKLQKKISQCKILDITLIKSSAEILVVTQRGELMIVNSLNLEQMYFYETYMSLDVDSKLLSITENKFIFYSQRNIRVIDIDENQQKLLQYQKPLKIYRNRIKIKKQQALLTKESGDIEFKKHTLKLDDSRKPLGFLANEENRGSSLQKFKSKFNKRKIHEIFANTNTETPHYILVLENGEILVYDYKAEYFGSYLKNRNLQVKQCLMNKKLFYLAVLYKDNSIQVINLYSQICIIKHPMTQDEQQAQRNEKNYFKEAQSIQEEQQIFSIGFMNSTSPNSLPKEQKNNSNGDFLYSIDKTLIFKIFNIKGFVVKAIDLCQKHIEPSFFSNLSQKRTSNNVYLDRDGQLIIGNEKGQVIFYQKNTLVYIKTIKIAYYPIVQIQSLQKASRIMNSKQRSKYILISTGNNQIYLMNKESKIFNKIYTPHKHIQEGKFIEIQKNLTGVNLLVSKEKQKDPKGYVQVIQNNKISSVHYFSKMVCFTEMFAVYEWEQGYEKIKFNQRQSKFSLAEQEDRQQTFNLKKTLESFLRPSAGSISEKNKQSEQNYQLHSYKRVGYHLQKLKPLNEIIEHKMSFRSQLPQTKKNESFFENQNLYFLQIWNTGQHKFPVTQTKRKHSIMSRSNDQNRPEHKSRNSLVYPYQLFCFAQNNRLTVIVEPQQQFHSDKNKEIIKNLSSQKNKKTSHLNSSLISCKNSLDQSNISISLDLNEKSLSCFNPKQTNRKEKSQIRVYDLEQFLKSKHQNSLGKRQLVKIILEQQI